MATELSELTNLLKIQNQNSTSNFKNLERVIEQVFSQMKNTLGGIKNLNEQQLSIARDSLNKELLEEQLIEKDIQQGDREIISALNEIEHILSQQFDFDRESENMRKLSEHIQPDYQAEQREQIDFTGIENLLRKLIDTNENISINSKSMAETAAEGFGMVSILNGLKDILFKLGGFFLKNPLLTAAGAGVVTGAAGGSFAGSVLTGGAVGLATGGLPGAAVGAGVGAAGWAAGKMMTKESSETDSKIGRWDDAGEPGSRIRGGETLKGDVEYGTKSGKFKFDPKIESIIKETSQKSGLDENYLRTMAHIESRGNPEAFNKGSKAAGLYQFIPSTAKTYGLQGKEFDPRANAEAAAKLSLSNKNILEKAGIEATPEMLYLAHQQGAGGAKSIIQAAKQGKSFSDLSPTLQRNIKSNVPGRKELSPQEFLDYWKSSYREHAAIAGIPEEETKYANKQDNKKETYTKSEKEIPEGKGYSEEESEIEEMDEPILEDPSLRNISRDEEAQQTMDSLFGPEESSKEQVLTTQKQQSLGMSPFGGIIQPTGGGLFGGGFGQQNPFGTIQGILGGLGSAVGMGQSMGNMGSMGGIYGAQGAIGGIQGMLGTLGMQSPALGQVGQAMGSIGNVMSSVQTAKNMGNMGGGGILGGINAASGVMGAAGSIFNAAQGLGSIFGQGQGQQTQSPSTSSEKGFFSKVGDSIGGLFGFGENKPEPEKIEWHKNTESLGPGDDAAALNFNREAAQKEPKETDWQGLTKEERQFNESNDVGVKSLFAGETSPKTESASLIPSPSTDGFSLEGATQSVQTGKEEMMMPSSGEGESPIVVNGGGGGGAGGGGGGGNSQSNPSSAGVMGIDIGVRNEEASLLRAQYGSLRIV